MAPFAGSTRLIPAMVCVAAGGMCAVMSGCDEKLDANTATVTLGGKKFILEVAADNAKRTLGLGKRASIEDDGGMLFAFPANEVRVQSFVMRDCAFDIDIIYLDGAGRILKMHNMKKEEPRGADEAADAEGFNAKYDNRLKKYSSVYPAQFVIEIKGGLLQSLGLKEGDLVKQRWDDLKRMAQ